MRRLRTLALAIALIGTLAAPAWAANILIYDQNTSQQNGMTALSQLGLSYTRGTQGDFNTLLTSGSWDLVILDLPSTMPNGEFGALVDYINGGGKALMSFWSLDSKPALASAFEVAVSGSFGSPQNVNAWNLAHPIFNGPYAVTDLVSWDDRWADDGDRLSWFGSGQALAGFGAPAADQGAIVLGNGGRTLYNGFLWDEFGTTGRANGVNLIANQIDFLLDQGGPEPIPEPTSLLLLGTGLLGLRSAVRRRR